MTLLLKEPISRLVVQQDFTSLWYLFIYGFNGTIIKQRQINKQVRLPTGVTCDNCVLQWYWTAGELAFTFLDSIH